MKRIILGSLIGATCLLYLVNAMEHKQIAATKNNI